MFRSIKLRNRDPRPVLRRSSPSLLPSCTVGQAQLHQAWTERWDGSPSGDDGGWAVATDSAGNIIVAGETGTAANGSDALVIKYDRSGKFLGSRPTTDRGTPPILDQRRRRRQRPHRRPGAVGRWGDELRFRHQGLCRRRHAPLGPALRRAGQRLRPGLAMDLDGQDNIYAVGIEEGTTAWRSSPRSSTCRTAPRPGCADTSLRLPAQRAGLG